MSDRAAIISTLQPKQQNIWDLYIPGIEGLNGKEETLMLSLRNMPLPKSTTAVITIPMDGTEAKYAGKTTFQDLNITLNDYFDRDTAWLVMEWRRQVYDPLTGISGLVSQYMKDGYMKVYTSEEDYVSTYNLDGCFLSSDDFGTVDKGSGDVIQLSCTLTVTRGYLAGPVAQ